VIGLGVIGTEGDVGFEFFGGLFEASEEGVHEGVFVERLHFGGHSVGAIGASVFEVSIHGDEFFFFEIFGLFAVDVIVFEFSHGFYYNKAKRNGLMWGFLWEKGDERTLMYKRYIYRG
jgi:hypothetical protein